ncbi:MAG: gamma-glutamyltransferase, partial [Gemmatimonadetes bacterium]|nr:gamma-glutamyltransferase [Gemmatimonadota bacterium]
MCQDVRLIGSRVFSHRARDWNPRARRNDRLAVLTLALTACSPGSDDRARAARLAETIARAADSHTGQQVASSPNGMVVTGAPLATAVGVHVLEQGGNAIDAAAAIAFTLGVVEPSQSGIGGRTQLLLRTADGHVAAIDGTTEVPVAYTSGPVDDEDAYGWSTIAVPGTVAALADAVSTFGTWPLARVMEPAIALASNGFALSDSEARRIAGARERLLKFDGSRAWFLRADGSPYAGGDTLRQPALAATLRVIAEGGADAFYRGTIAARMASELAANGALVTARDLAAYRAEPSIVVRGRFRGRELIGSYLPASGATTIEILQILDAISIAAQPGSAEWVAHVAQAILAGFEDREADVTPAEAKAEWLVSIERARQRAAQIGENALSLGADYECVSQAGFSGLFVGDRSQNCRIGVQLFPLSQPESGKPETRFAVP